MSDNENLGDLISGIISGQVESAKSETKKELPIGTKPKAPKPKSSQKKSKKQAKNQEKESSDSDTYENAHQQAEARRKKRQWEMIARTYPHPENELEQVKEKSLKRTARKGVVQLFNAVREHQKSLNRRQKGGNIQQRTAVIEETKDDFENLLEKKRRVEGKGKKSSLEIESKWKALQGDSAGEEEDWMDWKMVNFLVFFTKFLRILA